MLAGDLALLTLFLNPGSTLRADGKALFLSLFLPYAAATALVLALGLLVVAACRRRPWGPPALFAGLPWFTSLTLVAQTVAAALYWLNLLSYSHSIPLASVRGLAGASLSLTASALVLLAVGFDALLFPRRSRGPAAALVVLAFASAVVVPLALRPDPGRSAVRPRRPPRRTARRAGSS
jgi:hypothetical protein